MFRTSRRCFGNIAVLLLLAPSVAGCMTTRNTAFGGNNVGLDRITGVTMSSGRKIRFVEPGASVTNDTMYAIGRQGQILLPIDSISGVSTRRVSTARSLGLIAGLAVVGLVFVAATSSFKINLKPAVDDRR